MKPFRQLGSATAPDGTLLTLFEHDGAYMIRVNGIELMSTRRHQSEDALAELVCAPLAQQRGVRVLIGGLGLGFTLRAALRVLPADAQVEVAEIVPEVVAWNRNPEFALSHAALADPRVTVLEEDVGRVLRRSQNWFDAIMMDVDNGAESFTTRSNAALYRESGVHFAVAALRSGGRVAYWSATAEENFAGTMRHAGLEVRVTQVRAHTTAGPMHTILVGQRKE